MRKLLAYFRVSLIDAFIYRAAGFIWFLNDTGPAVIALIFWSAAFQTQSNFAGYTFSQMLIYYFGIMFINCVINTQPQYFLSEEVRNGDFSHYLLKPMSLGWFKFASNSSWRIVRLLFVIPLFLLAVKFFASDFAELNFNLPRFGLVIFSLILSFGINFFLKLFLGLTTIWFEESGWLFVGFDIFAAFLSGELIPLDLFPQTFNSFNNFLPFKYLLYFPLSLTLNRLSGQEIIFGFIFQSAWCLLAYLLYRVIFSRGRRVYSAYGR